MTTEWYLFVVFVASVFGLMGTVLINFANTLKKEREKKYYEMIRRDAAFWQMKLEQSCEMIVDEVIDELNFRSEMKELVKEDNKNYEEDDDYKEIIDTLNNETQDWIQKVVKRKMQSENL